MINNRGVTEELLDAAHKEGSTALAEEIAAQAGDPNFMASLARGLAVIQAFSQQRGLMSTSQISQRTGIPRAAVRRCLYTLNKLGFVSSADGTNFSVRPRILSLGHAYLASAPFGKAAKLVLQDLSKRLHESSSIAILDGDDILYISRAPTSRIMSIDLDIGSRLPAIFTSMGRVLLAHLPVQEQQAHLQRAKRVQYTENTLLTIEALRRELALVREQGYSIIDQELEMGLLSIAVPIKAPDGTVVAAINIGAHAARISIEGMKQQILPELRNAACELALLLA